VIRRSRKGKPKRGVLPDFDAHKREDEAFNAQLDQDPAQTRVLLAAEVPSAGGRMAQNAKREDKVA